MPSVIGQYQTTLRALIQTLSYDLYRVIPNHLGFNKSLVFESVQPRLEKGSPQHPEPLIV